MVTKDEENCGIQFRKYDEFRTMNVSYKCRIKEGELERKTKQRDRSMGGDIRENSKMESGSEYRSREDDLSRANGKCVKPQRRGGRVNVAELRVNGKKGMGDINEDMR